MNDYQSCFDVGRCDAEEFIYDNQYKNWDQVNAYNDGIESYLKETNYPLTLEEYIKSCTANYQK